MIVKQSFMIGSDEGRNDIWITLNFIEIKF